LVVDLRGNEERKRKRNHRVVAELGDICEFVAEEKRKGNCVIDAGDAVVAVLDDAGKDREDAVVDSDSARIARREK